jgi:hypothetical protein
VDYGVSGLAGMVSVLAPAGRARGLGDGWAEYFTISTLLFSIPNRTPTPAWSRSTSRHPIHASSTWDDADVAEAGAAPSARVPRPIAASVAETMLAEGIRTGQTVAPCRPD